MKSSYYRVVVGVRALCVCVYMCIGAREELNACGIGVCYVPLIHVCVCVYTICSHKIIKVCKLIGSIHDMWVIVVLCVLCGCQGTTTTMLAGDRLQHRGQRRRTRW